MKPNPEGGLPDEESQVRAAQQDPHAFAVLYDFYAPRMYRYVLHRIGNTNSAQDLTSQVFLDALQALRRYRPGGSFGGWLFTIARRRVVDYFRTNNPYRLRDVDGLDPETRPDDRVLDRENAARLAAILNELDDQETELLRLRFAAELTYRQIGEVLGIGEGAAKMRSARLVRKMRLSWEKDHE